MARWVEVVGGVFAALVGVVVAVVMGTLGAYWWAVALSGLSGLGAGIGAYQHGAYGRRQGLALLWISSLGLIIMTVLGVFSIGIFLLTGTLAALVAAVVGTWRSTAKGIA